MQETVPAVKRLEVLYGQGHMFPGQVNDATYMNMLTNVLDEAGPEAFI